MPDNNPHRKLPNCAADRWKLHSPRAMWISSEIKSRYRGLPCGNLANHSLLLRNSSFKTSAILS